MPPGAAQGQNPPYGAAINYWLKEPLKTLEKEKDGETEAASPKKNPVEITILDSTGQKVRTIKGTAKAGINRVTWDLAYEPTVDVRIRTTPAGNPHVWEEKRFRGKDSRGVFYYGIDVPKKGPLVAPGTYTVKLTVDGQEFSQPLVVRKDPNSTGGEQDIQQQTAMLIELRKDLESAADMVNQIEVIRSQLDAVKMLTQSSSDAGTIRSAADDLDKKLIAIEDNLIQRRLTGQGQDSVRWPPELLSKLTYLANGVSGSADFPPTVQQREVQAQFKEQLISLRKQLDDVVGKDVDAFNRTLRERNIQNVITRAP